jgi:hypothetical protein
MDKPHRVCGCLESSRVNSARNENCPMCMWKEIESLRARVKELEEGWKAESREGRKTFEQSCKNPERAEKAEALADELGEALHKVHVEWLQANIRAYRGIDNDGVMDMSVAVAMDSMVNALKTWAKWKARGKEAG